MAVQRHYATAGAFRTALEARLNERARRDGVDLHRLRRQVAFDQKVIEAIKAGFALPDLKVEMDALRARKEALLARLSVAEEPAPLLHPSMADLYRSKVEELAAALQREDTRLEASESLRGLVDAIVLTPKDGQLGIELRGNLAEMLTAAQQTKRSPETGDLQLPMKLVAGGPQPAEFGLRLHGSVTSAAYTSRKTVIGSTDAARRAGNHAASNIARASRATPPA